MNFYPSKDAIHVKYGYFTLETIEAKLKTGQDVVMDEQNYMEINKKEDIDALLKKYNYELRAQDYELSAHNDLFEYYFVKVNYEPRVWEE